MKSFPRVFLNCLINMSADGFRSSIESLAIILYVANKFNQLVNGKFLLFPNIVLLKLSHFIPNFFDVSPFRTYRGIDSLHKLKNSVRSIFQIFRSGYQLGFEWGPDIELFDLSPSQWPTPYIAKNPLSHVVKIIPISSCDISVNIENLIGCVKFCYVFHNIIKLFLKNWKGCCLALCRYLFSYRFPRQGRRSQGDHCANKCPGELQPILRVNRTTTGGRDRRRADTAEDNSCSRRNSGIPYRFVIHPFTLPSATVTVAARGFQ